MLRIPSFASWFACVVSGSLLLAQSPGTALWDFPVDGPLSHPGVAQIAPAVSHDGTIHFGAATSEGGAWYAVHPNGSLAWSYPLETQPTCTGTIGTDGTVYFASYNKLHALTANGAPHWDLDLTGPVYAPLALATDGTVYFASLDQQLYAVTAGGDSIWSFSIEGDLYAGPVVGGDGTVYLGAGTELVALSPTGEVRWRHPLGNRITESPAIAADGTIYVVDGDEGLHALDPDGTRLWGLKFEEYWSLTPPVVGADGTVFFGAGGGKVTAVWPDGTVRWVYTAGGSVQNGLVLGSDEMIYFNQSQGWIEAIDSMGQKIWELEDAYGFNTGPTLSPAGVLYLGQGENQLVAVKASSGPPERGWPMLQRNPQHTGQARTLPAIRLTEPPDGAVLVAGSEVSLVAEAVPGESALDRIEFFADGLMLGNAATAPFSMQWTATPIGVVRLTAVAHDLDGYAGFSPEVLVEVVTTAPRYPVHAGPLGFGVVHVAPAAVDYAPGSIVSLTAEPGFYHAFSRWTDGAIVNPRSIEVTSSNRYVAVFTNIVPVEVRLLPQGDWSSGGRAQDRLIGVSQTTDGGLFMAGSSQSRNGGMKYHAGFGDADYWLVKTSAEGGKVWEAAFGGTGADELTALLPLPDGSWLLGGHSRSPVSGNKASPHFGQRDYWLVRVDADGAKIWERSHGGERDDFLTALELAADGAILVGGYSESPAGGNKTAAQIGTQDFWILKLDAQGDRIWDRTVGAAGDDRLYALLATADGGYLAGGSTGQQVPGSGQLFSENYWVVKFDRFERRQWDRIFGGAYDDALRAMCPAVDGGYLLGGDSSSGVGGNKTTEGFGSQDCWLVRIDESGDKLWERTLGGTSTDVVRAVRSTRDGGFLVGAYSSSDVSGTKTVPSAEGDYWLIRLDHQGNEQTQGAFGGDAPDILSTLTWAPDGTILAAGRSQARSSLTKTAPAQGSDDYWAIRLAERLALPGTPAIFVNDRLVEAGVFEAIDAVQFRLESTLTGARLFFTLDGTPPNSSSTEFMLPVTLANSAVISAVAYSAGLDQAIQTAPVWVEVRVVPPVLDSAQTWGHPNRIMLTFTEPLTPNSVTNPVQFELDPDGVVLAAAPDPADPRRVILTTTPLDPAARRTLRVSGVNDLAGHAIAPRSFTQVNTELRPLADAGRMVPGFQDEFDAAERNPAWVPRGPGGDVYSVTGGSLLIAPAAGDPNHLLYEGPPHDGSVQDVLARLRVRGFDLGDAPRAGVAAGVQASTSQGLNFHLRNLEPMGRHAMFLDDFRAWGPGYDLAWENDQWLWLRLRFQPGAQPGEPDLLAKAWPSDGQTPEPMYWRLWDRFTDLPDRYGFAGLAAGAQAATAEFEVDYFLLQAGGLPVIRVAPEAVPVPPGLTPDGWNDTGGFDLLLWGQSNRDYRVEWSSDLLDWQELSSGTWTEPVVRITDPAAANRALTFYRAFIP